MAESVGPSGHVVGVELIPEMAAITCGKLVAVGFDDRAAVHVSAAEDFTTDLYADAMPFCYTHDVLQSPQAIENLLRHNQPGYRIAIVGWHWLPWPQGFPVNLFNAWRARHYLTTYCGLNRP